MLQKNTFYYKWIMSFNIVYLIKIYLSENWFLQDRYHIYFKDNDTHYNNKTNIISS